MNAQEERKALTELLPKLIYSKDKEVSELALEFAKRFGYAPF